MIVELGSVAYGATGNETINLNGSETPILIDFWTGPRNGTTETSDLDSKGTVDIVNGNVTWQSNFSDGTSSQTKSGVGSSTTTPCIQHYARISGTLTKVVDWTFVSAGAGVFTINVNSVVASSSNYFVYFRAYG